MDFSEEIEELARRAVKQVSHIATEEATKNALIMPFLSSLGYDVFNPAEVIPEFTADYGVKKGEKVDYALRKDGAITMLVECKPCGTPLDRVDLGQLYRYFSVTEVRVSVLTNGVVYRFYSDIDDRNKMDTSPFLEVDLLNLKPGDFAELKKLQKHSFDEDKVLASAGELKYLSAMKRVLSAQLQTPDDVFVEWLTRQVYCGRLTAHVREQFGALSRRAFREFITDQVNARLESAINRSGFDEPAPASSVTDAEGTGEPEPTNDVVTTAEEIEGFHLVRAILRQDVDVGRIAHRDVKSYFGILLDDNNRKPICRLHLNGGIKHLGLFDSDDRSEERVQIESLDDIYQYADRLRATLRHYLE
jgi:hypothetical protein